MKKEEKDYKKSNEKDVKNNISKENNMTTTRHIFSCLSH